MGAQGREEMRWPSRAGSPSCRAGSERRGLRGNPARGTSSRRTLFKLCLTATAQPCELIGDIRHRGVLLDLALGETLRDTVSVAPAAELTST